MAFPLSEFLKRNVRGYLLSDLQTLRLATPPTGPDGYVGYPMAMACISGIELMGLLLTYQNPKIDDGLQNFSHFWKRYVYAADAKKAALGGAVYELVRHGVAHTFLTKAGVQISKNNTNHLQMVGEVVNVDVLTLHTDFLSAYESVEGVLLGHQTDPAIDVAQVQARLDKLLAEFQASADSLRGNLKKNAAAAAPEPPVAGDTHFSTSAGTGASTTLVNFVPSGLNVSKAPGQT